MIFFNPVKIIFNAGARSELINECVNRKTLIFCTETAYKRYQSDILLRDLFNSHNVFFEHSFNSNPSIDDINRIGVKYKNHSINLVVGIGGGSAMDVAKIASASIPAKYKNIDINDLLNDNKLFDKFTCLKCLQVPTTAGTGSEVTPFATIWDYGNQKKLSLSHSSIFPFKAIIDPDLLIGMPEDIALSTGLDALNQAFESIWNINSSPISLNYAIKAACLSLKSLEKLKSINDLSHIRSNLSEASLYAGIAISQTRTSICHSISYPLTLKFDIPHGLACAFSMKEVYKFNSPHIKESLYLIEQGIGKNPYEIICKIFKTFSIESKIASYISNTQDVTDMLEEMETKGRFDNNIRTCKQVDLDNIIKASLKRLQNEKVKNY